MSEAQPTSVRRMLGRALLRRCPRCGGRGAWFTGWFKRVDRCRTCGYRYEREEGFMLGAIAVNTVVTSAAVVAALVVGIVLSYPEIAVVPILLACLAVAVLLPILLFPVTHTVWAAVELAMRPLAPAEEADAATYVAAGLADRAPAELVDDASARPDRSDRPESHEPEPPESPGPHDSGDEDT